ncbi:putative metal-binding motif-containing protein [Corallococcus sp. EGB]|uniref:putative metal-binding motif-containing protein n=1 Tax=Corallococcus sp. EGB TaxID=1521117 RepID=UPI001CBDC924|nr:putative metal-binding motif-containing protein [Corallococcus sp. EGB]
MQARLSGVSLLVMALLLAGCGSSTSPSEPVPDAGTVVDAGATDDAGIPDDAGSPDSGVAEGAPCEKTQGVCAGAKRAMVDGAYEPVCTARSYGAKYEETEQSCDGLDNDCDGVTDPATWADVAPMAWAPYSSMVDSLPVKDGFLVVVSDRSNQIQILRLDSALSLVGTTVVPVVTGSEPAMSAQLVRTSRGPALFFAAESPTSNSSTQGRFLPLDEQGTPLMEPPGILLFEQPARFAPARLDFSPDGSHGLVIWGSSSLATGDAREVLGMIVGANGQVLAEPRSLLQAKQERYSLYGQRVLGLDDGGFVVLTTEGPGLVADERLRLRRYDADLSQLGEERTFAVGFGANPMLVLSPPTPGSPSGEPILLLRTADGTNPRFEQVRALFENGVPEPLTPTTPGQSAWLGATMTSRGLQVAWISVRYAPVPGQDTFFDYEGRFWGMSPSGTVTDWTPGPTPMPLHRHAQWVLMHELPGQWMGALLMNATANPLTCTLRSVRYCAP